jgi:ribose/xylose/arabinose/galactoside ABC-type transport system permease subunit
VMWILLGVPIYAALPLAIGVGALVGLFNGALVTWLSIPSFIVTLGSYNLLYGVSLWITKTSTFNPVYPPPGVEIPDAQLDFFTGLTASFGSHPISLEVVWMLGLALVIGFLLHRTLFGFRLMAIGGNPVAARLARLPVTRYKILAFVICGMLAAAAGILDFSFIQTTQPNIGLSYTFPVFAAVIIGGASLSGGKGTVIGAMSGALLLAELQQGLALLSPGPHVQQLFLGFVTIGAVALDLALTNIRKRRAA